ncbi:MAG: serine hydrolase [Ahrensia sp.]|nr:serine hydrolase [Ahrensia sp.]
MSGESAREFGFDPERLKRIDQWMARNIDLGRFTGSSVLIARHGEIVHLGCVGKASLADDRDYARDTIVRIYSMTKLVTSVAFMMLLERGILHLDAPVSRFLPQFSQMKAFAEGATDPDDLVDAPSPTLHQLLTHTSGMSYSFNPGMLGQLYNERGIDTGPGVGGLDGLVGRIANMPLGFQPGERWEYSVGIDVIGRVIEIVSGRSLDAFFREEIFEPLGMIDTFFDLPSDRLPRFADCFVKTPDDPRALFDAAETSIFLSGKVNTLSGGGGLLSTLDDYFRFGEMLRRGGALDGVRLLSPNSVAFMRANHLPGDIASMGPGSFAEMPMNGMGFGIGGAMVLDPALARMPGSVGDFGWGGYASTFFWTDPVKELSCIFFTQLIPSFAYPNRAELKALVHGALME